MSLICYASSASTDTVSISGMVLWRAETASCCHCWWRWQAGMCGKREKMAVGARLSDWPAGIMTTRLSTSHYCCYISNGQEPNTTHLHISVNDMIKIKMGDAIATFTWLTGLLLVLQLGDVILLLPPPTSTHTSVTVCSAEAASATQTGLRPKKRNQPNELAPHTGVEHCQGCCTSHSNIALLVDLLFSKSRIQRVSPQLTKPCSVTRQSTLALPSTLAVLARQAAASRTNTHGQPLYWQVGRATLYQWYVHTWVLEAWAFHPWCWSQWPQHAVSQHFIAFWFSVSMVPGIQGWKGCPSLAGVCDVNRCWSVNNLYSFACLHFLALQAGAVIHGRLGG